MRSSVKAIVMVGAIAAVSSGLGRASGALRNDRGYVAGRYELELDGATAGWVYDMAGGSAVGNVAERLGTDRIFKKQISNIKYEDITVHVGTGMSKGFYQWIIDTLARKSPRKTGAVIVTDFNNKEASRLTYSNALLSEVEFPALDAASKERAKIAVTLTPEYTRLLRGQGKSVAVHEQAAVDKKWFPSNFRLKIDGLDMSKVSKIDALKFKMKTTDQGVGNGRDYQIEPTTIEVPNLVVTLPESQAEAVVKWHEEFVIKGVNGDDKEKNGTLEYLTTNLQNVYFTISFKHLGIFKIEPEKSETSAESIRRVRVYMYCEDASFAAGKDTSL